jgi:hypothetical protein
MPPGGGTFYVFLKKCLAEGHHLQEPPVKIILIKTSAYNKKCRQVFKEKSLA